MSDATWSELIDILDAHELTAVTDSCGGDDEPSADDITRAFEDNVPSTPEPQQTPHVPPGWRNHEPPVVHSVTWTDSSGLNHMHCVRGDTLDEVLIHIRKLRAVIDAAKARDAKASESAQTSVTDSRSDWCHVHNTAMKQRGDESKGYWHSHKTTDGLWCRGRA